MNQHSGAQALTISTTRERVELARRTHRSVTRTLFTIFCILAAVIFGVGIPLAVNGRASLWGVIGVGAVFVIFPFFVALSNSKIERTAERYLASDGETQFVVGPTSLVVGDTVLPYERMTYLYANAEGEEYSNGGIRGEIMAYRMDLTDQRPTAGRAIGSRIGTAQRKKLYRDGAKSGISLAIGIDQKSTISAPKGVINELKTLPKRGDDPGRIDVPFGAYLTLEELHLLLGAVYQATGGIAFPIALVSGALNWASATTAAGDTRETIWKEFATLVPPVRETL